MDRPTVNQGTRFPRRAPREHLPSLASPQASSFPAASAPGWAPLRTLPRGPQLQVMWICCLRHPRCHPRCSRLLAGHLVSYSPVPSACRSSPFHTLALVPVPLKQQHPAPFVQNSGALSRCPCQAPCEPPDPTPSLRGLLLFLRVGQLGSGAWAGAAARGTCCPAHAHAATAPLCPGLV